MIIVDSREKKWSHIAEYFQEHNIEYNQQKVDVGDYMDSGNNTVSIDRKANLQELCSCLMKGKSNCVRFTNECKRAKESGIKLIVLIEGTKAKSIKDLATWKSKYSAHTGKWLTDRMFELTVTYGVEWKFCEKNQTAKRILEILGYD